MHKAAVMTHKCRLQSAISILQCFKSTQSPRAQLQHTHAHISANHSCFPFSLLPSCPTCKFQGRPVKAQSSIKTMMLPQFLYESSGSSTDATRGERIHTLPSLSMFFFSPALISFVVTFSIALFALALCLLSAHPCNLVRMKGQRA